MTKRAKALQLIKIPRLAQYMRIAALWCPTADGATEPSNDWKAKKCRQALNDTQPSAQHQD